jgi:hypothetical protein
MIKRINSTGRRRIPGDRVVIEVVDGTPRTFNATVDLEGFDAPPDAEIVLEATCAGSNTILRFPWGTVASPLPADDRTLRDLNGRNVFFALKVVDRTQKFGRILGLAENVRPIKGGNRTETGRRGILPVESADLGQELWRLDFRTEDVFLLVNASVPGLADRVRSDPLVFGLVYPAVIREVLDRALEEQVDDDEDNSDSWASLWRAFGKTLHPERVAAPDRDDEDECREWIDDVVAAFTEQHQLAAKFRDASPGSGGGESS